MFHLMSPWLELKVDINSNNIVKKKVRNYVMGLADANTSYANDFEVIVKKKDNNESQRVVMLLMKSLIRQGHVIIFTQQYSS